MTTLGGDLIKTIRAFAETTNDPNAYTAASIPPPAPPTPAGAPVPPTAVVADPNADGTVTLRWKGSLAKQTFYTVWRRAGAGAFVQVASVAAKRFVDADVPGAVASVTYYLRAQRGNAVSAPSGEATVNFGGGVLADAA